MFLCPTSYRVTSVQHGVVRDCTPRARRTRRREDSKNARINNFKLGRSANVFVSNTRSKKTECRVQFGTIHNDSMIQLNIAVKNQPFPIKRGDREIEKYNLLLERNTYVTPSTGGGP